ncbi:MAG: DUF72 domain-containing protein [Pseudomonadota bacterium]|jgi:uncharacterized protein YecE (DUF72 family)
MTGTIRAGIGGWTFEPWRGTFYPAGLKKADELKFASRALTAIEINGTFYATQKPTSFRKWHDETPDGFMFSVKANRFCTNRRELAGAKDSIEHFIGSGLDELKGKLGPILWQFMPTKKFDPDDFEAFLALLPRKLGALPLRHAVEVRHESFVNADFVNLVRNYGAAIVLAESEDYPMIADATADFVYLRLQQSQEKYADGYAPAALKAWAARAKTWAKGDAPDDLDTLAPAAPAKARDVFAFFISGDKVKAPAAAQAFIKLAR